VALAEEGYAGHEVTRIVAKEYLASLLEEGIDTLVLGCTHYPLLKKDIQAVIGPDVQLVDSATAIAHAVGARLVERNHHRETDKQPEYRFCVSDTPDRFRRVGSRFLNRAVDPVEVVALDTLAHLDGIPTTP
jgi:glutamate racemase